jgi:hypothetical protein
MSFSNVVPIKILPGEDIYDFCEAYEPMTYLIDEIVIGSYLYTLTARTGAGKTAFNTIASLAIATGREDILRREVTQGRVAYLAFENPDDTRLRFMIATHHYGVDVSKIREQIRIFTKGDKPEKICRELEESGPFSLILIDTFQAIFDGDNINDNSQCVNFLRRVRPMTQIKGHPAVIISAHPVKGANDDNLVPYGAGAIVNEVDGNLTLLNRDGRAELHWQRKIRGLDFKAVPFQIDLAMSNDILDAKGRRMNLPVMQAAIPRSTEEVERADKARSDRAMRLLAAMKAKPDASQREWQSAMGAQYPSAVTKALKVLERDGLVQYLSGLKRHRVTPKGLALLKDQKGASNEGVQDAPNSGDRYRVFAEGTSPLEAAENKAVPEILAA